MPTNVTFNGVIYPIPVQGDRNWAPPLTRFLVAVGNGSFQTTGGAFTLSADANFGTSFGLLAKYFTSVTSTPATSGVLRLAKTDSIGWKNNAGSGNLLLGIDGTDQLTFNGVQIATPSVLTQNHIYVGNASNQPANVAMSGDATIVSSGALTIANGAITDAKVNASAAITLSKLAALSASIVPVTDGSGFLTSSSTTATELGYVHGVTSDIQTQLNAKQVSGNYITALTGDVTASGPGSVASTLATVNSNVGSFSNANITVNAKGLITAASSGNSSVAPTRQQFTTGSGTYTRPTNPTPLYLKVTMIGAGGGVAVLRITREMAELVEMEEILLLELLLLAAVSAEYVASEPLVGVREVLPPLV